METPEQKNQPSQLPPPRIDDPEWNKAIVSAVHYGYDQAEKHFKAKLHFRTFASSVAGVWMIGMVSMAMGVSLFSLLIGAGLTTFAFYVMDQTERTLQGFVSSLRKKKEKKKDGDNSGSDPNQH